MPHGVLTAGIKRVGMGGLSLAFPASVKPARTPHLRCIDPLGQHFHNPSRGHFARIKAACTTGALAKPRRRGDLRTFPMLNGKTRSRALRLILVALALLAALGLGLADAMAQGWNWWPFGGGPSEPRPIPREPLYRGPPG